MEKTCVNCKHSHINSWSNKLCDKNCDKYNNLFEPIEEKPMETKCKDCKYSSYHNMTGIPCTKKGCVRKNLFVSIEEKSLDNLVGKFHCITCGKKLIRGESCDCKSESMEQKKYRALKDYKLPLTQTIVLVKGNIYSSYDLEGFDIDELINQGYIEEVKEDTLESIIDENFIGDEIKKNLKQCIIKQKIELLKFIHLSYSEYIYNKISELQKEITDGEKV